MTERAMLPESSTSNSAGGSGTKITSTLAMMASGNISSWPRRNQSSPAAGAANEPEAIHGLPSDERTVAMNARRAFRAIEEGRECMETD
jgi:hypothetical protein